MSDAGSIRPDSGRLSAHAIETEKIIRMKCRIHVDMTFCRIVDELSRLDLRYDRENAEEYFSGPSDSIDLFMDVVEALGIDADHLIN